MIVRSLGFTAAVSLALAGASGPAGAAPAAFDPAAFFTGKTVSSGTLKEMFSAAKPTRVATVGSMRADGTLVLDQDVAIGSDPVRHRVWKLRETAPGRFTGSISDATSPVSGRVAGDTLTLSYTLEGGLKVAQTLTLAPGGQSAHNAMTVRKFGVVVARLSETIRRQGR